MVALRSLCVFCGSSSGRDPAHTDLAVELGRTLAEQGVTLVYGGASVGLMGAIADACLDAGGSVVGVIPRGLFRREVAHRGITELIEVETMHERKAVMYDRADAFVALPGGFGTLDELFECLTWSQIGIHGKPSAVLDSNGFWAPLLAQLDGMVDVGLLRPENRALLHVATTPTDLLDVLRGAEVTVTEKWIDPDER